MTPALATAERIARAVFAFDLAGTPLYVLSPEAVGIASAYFHGLHCSRLERLAKPVLVAAGRWEGSGPVVLARDDASESSTVGLVLHEGCHWIDFAPPASADDLLSDDDVRELFEGSLGRLVGTFTAPTSGAAPAGLKRHEERFTRIACHAWYRATRAVGYFIDPRQLAFGNVYPTLGSLSPPDLYASLLYEECQALRHLPIRQIAAMPPPTDFHNQWCQDLARLFEQVIAAETQAA